MTDRPFRFGVVAGLAPTGAAWTETARRAENLGYDTLLVPDTLWTLSPWVALSAAAAATSTLRLGTFVLNAPLRTPAAVAHEAMSLDLASDGRFELGLGAGRPGAEAEAARLGLPWGTPGQRVDQLAETIRTVKETLAKSTADATAGQARGPVLRAVQQPGPPIMVAGAGRRLLTLAAREADIVALGVAPTGTEYDLATKVGELRDVAGDRFDRLEIAYNLAAVAPAPSDLPGWLAGQLGGDPAELARGGSAAILTGSPTEIADALRRRRDALGISYINVNGAFMDQLAPVVEALTGR
ncbi:probable F420-dependent oxidoreductase, MSMEG_2516 family [Actinopolymorpha cephalotaxi]|uniref:F420-dependent oxidoreductase n=1 Tax=Actinopolymorpha cephalotaxi TaxID=504797 RepID=A0A1I2YDH8_9ACTN|nr:TIGR03621 family F420-dependent LLM class oxidoreductase [Actinopolymorpha cephalotaxi]NYH87036.1 putative F420-dependent oxidoreductase [Actinopolymorpha cephalotaxi]SFH23407.1 probable F420-dependent oxidoreductase, MSMEG_2516 family [Actinopolymorpha cephalotaxi]